MQRATDSPATYGASNGAPETPPPETPPPEAPSETEGRDTESREIYVASREPYVPRVPASQGDRVPAAQGDQHPTRTDPAGDATRPRVDALTAVLRYPLLLLIPVVILAAAAYALVRQHPTTWTAEAQVLMQQPAPTSSAALPGVVQAELSLAPVYARELDFDPVVVPLAQHFHMAPGAVAADLSATPVPNSPIIRIDASARSSRTAIALANDAATKLSAFVSTQVQSTAGNSSLLLRYQQASAAYESALTHERRMVAAHSARSPAVVKAIAAADVAQLRQRVLASEYQSLTGQGPTSPGLGVFQRATAASSNQRSNLEIYLFAGVLAGLVIGVALATLAANRGRPRTALAS